MNRSFFRSLVILERLTVTDSTIYAIGLAKSYASYTLHVTALSVETGELSTTRNIPSSIENGPDDFLSLSPATSEDPRLVWIEKGVVKSVALTPKLANKPQSLKGSTNAKIADVGLSEYGLFVVRKEDGSASVFRLNQNAIESIWDFADSVGYYVVVLQSFADVAVPQASSNKNSDSMYTGAVDKEGNPYVGRMYWSFTLQVCYRGSYAEPFLSLTITRRAVSCTSSHLTSLAGRDWLLDTPSRSTLTIME